MGDESAGMEFKENFLDDLIGKEYGNNKKRLIEMKKREEMSLQWRIWKAVTGGNKGEAVTAVEYKKEGNIVKVDTRVEVEEELMKCLTKRFSLTNQCTSMSKSFIEKIWIFSGKAGCRDGIKRRHPE